jgi:hypothetical protein
MDADSLQGLLKPRELPNAREWLDALVRRNEGHSAYDHRFLIQFSKGVIAAEQARMALAQYFPVVNAISIHIERALGPGCQTDGPLFLKLLSSIGAQPLAGPVPVQVFVDQFDSAITTSTVQGLAWIGPGGLATYLSTLSYISQGCTRVFGGQHDRAFFEYHGCHVSQLNARCLDQLAVLMRKQHDYDVVRREVDKSLFLRSLIWDEIARISNG